MICEKEWLQYVLGIVASVMVASLSVAADRQALIPNAHREVLRTYCYDCHDSSTAEAMVDLESLSLEVSRDIPTGEMWAKVLNAINSGEMPPEDAEPISDADKQAFLRDLSEQMVIARKILNDSGGVVTLRRLNRREYANTIEALLGVLPDVSNLPNDQASAGFDTQGASLFISSDQIEQYLAAAKQALELALLERQPRRSKITRVEPEEFFNAHYAAAAEVMRDTRHRSQTFLAQTEKPAADFGFLDAYQAKKQGTVEWLPLMEDYLSRPETETGATLIMTIKQGGYTRIKLPTLHEGQEGRYTVRVRVGAYPDARERLHYLEFTTTGGSGAQRLGWRKVTAPLTDPQVVEFTYDHRPGTKRQLVIHQRSHQDRADKNQATIDRRQNGLGTPPGLWVDWAELEGPAPNSAYNEARDRVLFKKPADWDEQRYAEEVIRRFATTAFRGQSPDQQYLVKLSTRYRENRDAGASQVEALLDPLSIVLSSPSFLYMVESTSVSETSADADVQAGIEAAGRGGLAGVELAVRLSYLLWSAPPDAELMQLGQSGKLLEAPTLRAQTARLLADTRVHQFTRGFVHQWLQMDRLGMFQFDGVQFPTFDNAARELAGEEIYQTFDVVMRQRLPLETLLNADFVVINDLLAGYYGIPNVEGHQFRKVPVGKDSPRGGLLGTAAIHAMGSDGQRSSPVERGAWVLRKLLNAPPPPAPPNVPMLSRLDGEVYSARDLASAHQEQPQCANCHQKIDPVGFGLENFSAVGLWRETEVLDKRGKFGMRVKLGEFEIDPSGRFPDGTEFDDFFDMRACLSRYRDDFARGFTESLITYGLGRPYGFTDQDLADGILQTARSDGNSVEAFVHALVQSNTFRNQ